MELTSSKKSVGIGESGDLLTSISTESSEQGHPSSLPCWLASPRGRHQPHVPQDLSALVLQPTLAPRCSLAKHRLSGPVPTHKTRHERPRKFPREHLCVSTSVLTCRLTCARSCAHSRSIN